jgi:hypothetical protein
MMLSIHSSDEISFESFRKRKINVLFNHTVQMEPTSATMMLDAPLLLSNPHGSDGTR